MRESKVCTVCQLEKPTSEFYRIKNTSRTSTIWFRPECKGCVSEYKKSDKSLKSLDKYRHSMKGRFVMLKATAKRKGIECSLTFAEYELIAADPCRYCSGFFETVDTIGYRLDRVDNSKGYVSSNVVSCCHTCNSIKLDKFSVEETLAAVRAIIEVRRANNGTFPLLPRVF